MDIDLEFDGIVLRPPVREDGVRLNLFVRINPPLDMNSVYCNVLQCTHFADTCILAEKDGDIVGYVTGYRMPAHPEVYFLWQVGVGRDGRGQGLGTRMIQAILARDACRGVHELNTTITPSNEASRHMFASFARAEGAEMQEEAEYFSREALGDHEAESLFRIGPLSTPRPA
ncbi:MAG: diaminobutyrate acetyltransferase [Halioglobus sp.]|nr:diaminobutyrate acetyltransferase [Halioglobus sp.]